jgi:hypothetical protein
MDGLTPNPGDCTMTTQATPKPLKTIRSHTGFSRFMAELDTDDNGDLIIVREIPRSEFKIPSPYDCGPTWFVYRYKGKEVITVETSHRCYQVFAAP